MSFNRNSLNAILASGAKSPERGQSPDIGFVDEQPRRGGSPVRNQNNIPSAAAVARGSSQNGASNTVVRAPSLSIVKRRGASPGSANEAEKAEMQREFERMLALCRQHTSEKASGRSSGNGGNTGVKFAYNVERVVRKLTGQTLDRVRGISDAIFARIAETGHIEETDAATRVDRIAAGFGSEHGDLMSALKQKLLSKIFTNGVVTEIPKFRKKDQSREEFVDRMIDKSISEVRASSSISTSYDQDSDSYKAFVDHVMESFKRSDSEYIAGFRSLFNEIDRELQDKKFSDKFLSDLVYIYLSQYAKSVTNGPGSLMKKETFYVIPMPGRNAGGFNAKLREALDKITTKQGETKNEDGTSVLEMLRSKGFESTSAILRLGDIKTFMNEMIRKIPKPVALNDRQSVANLYFVVVRKILKDLNEEAASVAVALPPPSQSKNGQQQRAGSSTAGQQRTGSSTAGQQQRAGSRGGAR